MRSFRHARRMRAASGVAVLLQTLSASPAAAQDTGADICETVEVARSLCVMSTNDLYMRVLNDTALWLETEQPLSWRSSIAELDYRFQAAREGGGRAKARIDACLVSGRLSERFLRTVSEAVDRVLKPHLRRRVNHGLPGRAPFEWVLKFTDRPPHSDCQTMFLE